MALEGALCCLRSLKGGPRKGGDGGGEALEGALKVLAAVVGDFFGKKRGGGFTSLQVCPVLVYWCVGAVALCVV